MFISLTLLPRLAPFAEGMKFATQISPLLNSDESRLQVSGIQIITVYLFLNFRCLNATIVIVLCQCVQTLVVTLAFCWVTHARTLLFLWNLSLIGARAFKV